MLDRTLQRLLLQLFLVICLVVGPVGPAFANADGCAPDCPCDDEADHSETDEPNTHDEVVKSEIGSVDACEDQCTDCDCGGGLVAAVLPASSDRLRGSLRVDRVAARPRIASVGANPDIFRPPRTQR